MIVKQEFKVTCRGCGVEFTLYEYEGFSPGNRYGSHHCDKLIDYFCLHPRARAFDYVKKSRKTR